MDPERAALIAKVQVVSMDLKLAGGVVSVAGGWSLERIGSVWHMDEEYHVYVPEDVVAQVRGGGPRGHEILAVSPVLTFREQDGALIPATSAQVMTKAASVFRRIVRGMAAARRDIGGDDG